MSQELSPTDWSAYLDEWRESIQSSPDISAKNDKPYKPLKERKKEARKNKKGRVITYTFIRILRQTPKAKFFVTNEGIGGTFGFWCPKAAISSETKDVVEVQDWCDITEIEFK